MGNKANNKSSILVLGDINVDVMGRVKAWPEPGDDCLAAKLEMHCGGVGANCALGLARWGVSTRLVGCVGQDLFGDHVLKALEDGGVDVRWVQRTTAALTGMLYINITPDGERTFFGSRGANGLFRQPRHWAALNRRVSAAHLAGHSFLNSASEKAAKQLINAVHACGGWVSLDIGMEPSKAIPQKILQMSRRVDTLLLSSDEAVALTAARDPYEAFARLQKAGAREVVLKFGRRGCLVCKNDTLTLVPSFAVRTVDSTGAGDAFVAAFLQARLRGWSTLEGALAANAAGALAATVVGAGDNLPNVRDIGAFLRVQRLEAKWDAVRLRVLTYLPRNQKKRWATSPRIEL
jgi:ribokinase